MLTDEQKTIAKTAIQDYCGGDYRDDYSGRGMYGDTCPAVVYESQRDAINDMIEMMSLDDLDPMPCEIETHFALKGAFKSHKMDSMGRGVVLYFPALKAKKGENQ